LKIDREKWAELRANQLAEEVDIGVLPLYMSEGTFFLKKSKKQVGIAKFIWQPGLFFQLSLFPLLPPLLRQQLMMMCLC